jgi:hypothetical protein
MAHDVFISYSTQDKAAADAICHGLETNGVRCWIAPRDVRPGADWQQEILDAIAGSKAVVLVFTAHTNQSDNVKKEVSAAVNAKAVVIPFMIEDVDPEGALKYHLEGVHWMDAYLPPLENHIEKLAAAIRNLAGSADAAPAPIIVSEPIGGAASPEPPHPTPPPYAAPPYGAPPYGAPPPPPAPGPVAGLTRNHYLVGGLIGVAVVLLAIGAQHLMTKSNGNEVNSSAAASASSAAAESSAATAESSSQPDRHVRVYNDTRHTMEHFYASNTSVNSWQEDILGSSVLAPGESANINIDDGTGACEFDFKAVFDDNQSLIRHDVNVCNIGTYRYTE